MKEEEVEGGVGGGEGQEDDTFMLAAGEDEDAEFKEEVKQAGEEQKEER